MTNVRIISYLVAGGAALITGLSYAPTFQNGFVWDDFPYVLNNTSIQNLSLEFFVWVFTRFHMGNWNPLTWVSHAIDIQIWGVDPRGHHGMNIALHVVNTVIVFFLTLRVLAFRTSHPIESRDAPPGGQWTGVVVAGTTSVLFGVHPTHVESVAWVAERKDLLCGFFFLLSVFFYLKVEPDDRYWKDGVLTPRGFGSQFYWTTFGFFLMALMSKPMAVTLPLVLLLLDWYPLKRIHSLGSLGRALVAKIPFWIVSLLVSIVTILAQRSSGAIRSTEITPLFTRILIAARSLTAYLENLAIPRTLSPLYPYPEAVEAYSLKYVFSLVLVILITAAAGATRKKHPVFLAVWGYFAITLLPVLGFVPLGWQAMADRYLYLPGLGAFLLIGLLTGHTYEKVNQLTRWRVSFSYLIAILLLAITTLLALRASMQIRIWKDDLSLWSHVIQTQPPSVVAFNNRGAAFSQSGQSEQAVGDYLRAIELGPQYYELYTSIGIEYGKLGRLDAAIEAFGLALGLNPDDADAYLNRATAYALLGQNNKALPDYDASIRLNPESAPAYLNRGKMYEGAGDSARAVRDFTTACDLGNLEACDILRWVPVK